MYSRKRQSMRLSIGKTGNAKSNTVQKFNKLCGKRQSGSGRNGKIEVMLD